MSAQQQCQCGEAELWFAQVMSTCDTTANPIGGNYFPGHLPTHIQGTTSFNSYWKKKVNYDNPKRQGSGQSNPPPWPPIKLTNLLWVFMEMDAQSNREAACHEEHLHGKSWLLDVLSELCWCEPTEALGTQNGSCFAQPRAGLRSTSAAIQAVGWALPRAR